MGCGLCGKTVSLGGSSDTLWRLHTILQLFHSLYHSWINFPSTRCQRCKQYKLLTDNKQKHFQSSAPYLQTSSTLVRMAAGDISCTITLVWYKQWCRPKVVGGRTVPQGSLQGNSHNALGHCEKAPKRFSEGQPKAAPEAVTFFIGPILGSAHGRGLVISAGWGLVIGEVKHNNSKYNERQP